MKYLFFHQKTFFTSLPSVDGRNYNSKNLNSGMLVIYSDKGENGNREIH